MTPDQAKRILDQLKGGDADYSDSVIRQALVASGDLVDKSPPDDLKVTRRRRPRRRMQMEQGSPPATVAVDRSVRPRAWYQTLGDEVLTECPEAWGRADEPWVPLYALPTDWALFEVVNLDGLTEAATEGPRETALAEAMHYAAQYAQDGTVTVFEVLRVPLLVIPGPNVVIADSLTNTA